MKAGQNRQHPDWAHWKHRPRSPSKLPALLEAQGEISPQEAANLWDALRYKQTRFLPTQVQRRMLRRWKRRQQG